MTDHWMQERLHIYWWPRRYFAYGKNICDWGIKPCFAIGTGQPPRIPRWERALMAVMRGCGHHFFKVI